MSRGILAAAVLAASLLATGPGNAVSNPTANAGKFTLQGLQSILAEMGIQSTPSIEGGVQRLHAVAPDGTKFRLVLFVCDADGACAGLLNVAWWTRPEGFSTTLVNSFNEGSPFFKAFRSADGSLGIARYVTADFGIPRGNVEVELANFLQGGGFFAEFERKYGQMAGLNVIAPRAQPASLDAPARSGERPHWKMLETLESAPAPADLVNRY